MMRENMPSSCNTEPLVMLGLCVLEECRAPSKEDGACVQQAVQPSRLSLSGGGRSDSKCDGPTLCCFASCTSLMNALILSV